MEKRTYSCAAYGAALGFMSVQDAAVVIHGSRSCQNMMFTFKNNREREKRRFRTDLGNFESTRMYCTEMTEMDAVFGGGRLLEEKIDGLLGTGWRNIFVSTTCVPGLIGDRCREIASHKQKDNPGTCIGCAETSGNMTGDWEEGFNAASKVLCGYADPDAEQDDSINILAERYFYYFSKRIDDRILSMLDDFDVRVNCRYLYRSSMDDIVNLGRAECNLVAIDDYISDTAVKEISSSIRRKQHRMDPPLGFDAYRGWIKDMSSLYRPKDGLGRTEDRIDNIEEECLARSERICRGRRALIYHEETDRIDWEVDALRDLGMECVVTAKASDRGAVLSRNPDTPVLSASDVDSFRDLLRDTAPDIIVSDTPIGASRVKQHHDVPDRTVSESDDISFRTPLLMQFYPGLGIEGVVEFMDRVNLALQGIGIAGWRYDE